MRGPRSLSAAVELAAFRTPTIPPATHTNSYALGSREVVLVEPADQMRGAAVHEARDQAFVQRVGDIILGLARLRLVAWRVRQPVGAGGDIGPDADIREPRHQRIEVALGIVERGDGAGHPVVGQTAILRQMA